jgi:hypothetical protein
VSAPPAAKSIGNPRRKVTLEPSYIHHDAPGIQRLRHPQGFVAAILEPSLHLEQIPIPKNLSSNGDGETAQCPPEALADCEVHAWVQ